MNLQKFQPPSFRFLSAFWIQMRPYLLFISGIAGLSGMAVAYEVHSFAWPHILGFIAFFLSYGFGQAFTDTFQLDTDQISASYRPLSAGVISVKNVRILSLAGLMICVIILLVLNPWNLLLGILSMFGLYSYTYFKKNFWFAGPFHNAWIVAILPIMGYLVVSGNSMTAIWVNGLLWVVLLNFFAYVNFVLIGYLKDITADRMTGYQTFPVVFGWNKTILAGLIIVLISMLLCGMIIQWSGISILVFIIGSLVSLAGLFNAWFQKEKTELKAKYAIESVVRSFILWNAAIIVHYVSDSLLWLIAFYLLFELMLWKRPERSQI